MAIFKIGTTDLTNWVDRENYNCNITDVFQNWTDGNWVDHREVVRTQIKATITLKFPRETDFNAFKALLTSQRDVNGYYPVTVWVNNTQTEESINAFIDTSAVTKWDVTCPRKWRSVSVAVTQR